MAVIHLWVWHSVRLLEGRWLTVKQERLMMPLERESQTRQDAETGTIHNMTRLSPPATALAKNGRLVKILAVGNVEGFSPACWVVNGDGEIDLESTSKFTVIDSHFLPPDARAYSSIATKQQGSSKY